MYDKSLLAKSIGASFGVVAIVAFVFVSTGTAYALPVSGIGGFSIQADQIEGDDMLLYPGVHETNTDTDRPVAVVELRRNVIDGLQLEKTIDLDALSGNVLTGNFRLVIGAGDGVEAQRLLLKTPSLTADDAVFSGLEIENRGGDDLNRVFDIEAPSDPDIETRRINLTGGENPGLTLDNADIQATYLATDQISLPDMSLDVEYDPDGDGTYEIS
jgi:hypothetical protein